MSSYKEHRRANLMALEKKFGSLEALSDAVEVSASYLSQMKNNRHMGDKVARRFEQKLGLPKLSMDQPPGGMAAEPGGKQMSSLPHYSPDERVQEFLKDYMELPSGLKNYLRRRAREMKLYSQKLTQFQRNNFPEPPVDPEGFDAWKRELDAELDSVVDSASASEKRKVAKVR